MSLKTLIIYQNENLFNILNELYSEEFKIIFFNKKNIKDFDQNKLNNYLIITDSVKLQFKNQLILNKFPLSIKKILELINIYFLKYNFRTNSKIKIGFYTLNLNSRELASDNKKLSLTEREANLILFLNNSSKPMNIIDLQKEVWGHSSILETHTVETHIYRLRKKINQSFNDNNFITSSKQGYSIL